MEWWLWDRSEKKWENGSKEGRTHQRNAYDFRDLKRKRDVGEEHGSIGPKMLTQHQIIKFQFFFYLFKIKK